IGATVVCANERAHRQSAIDKHLRQRTSDRSHLSRRTCNQNWAFRVHDTSLFQKSTFVSAVAGAGKQAGNAYIILTCFLQVTSYVTALENAAVVTPAFDPVYCQIISLRWVGYVEPRVGSMTSVFLRIFPAEPACGPGRR